MTIIFVTQAVSFKMRPRYGEFWLILLLLPASSSAAGAGGVGSSAAASNCQANVVQALLREVSWIRREHRALLTSDLVEDFV